MTPFQVDPSWYERYWWREPPPRRRWLTRERLLRAAALAGRFLWSALRFLGIVLALLASGDFGQPRRDHVPEPVDQGIEPDCAASRVPNLSVWE